MSNLIQQIKEYAEAHYEEGYDVIVECWDEEDFADYIAPWGITRRAITTLQEFIESYAPVVAVRQERQTVEGYHY